MWACSSPRPSSQGYEHVGLGEVSGQIPSWKVDGDNLPRGRESFHTSMVTGQIDLISSLQPKFDHLMGVHHHHAPMTMYPAVAVIQAVDGRVVLIVAPEGHENETIGLDPFPIERMDSESCKTVRGGEPTLVSRLVRQCESRRLADC